MVFLAPLMLFGLLAVLVPVAIHLIRRERPPRVMFGTIRFLKQTPRRLVLFQRLRQVALMLLRCAVVALLAMAFARPLLDPRAARLAGADPQSAVVLLDLSMSMRYGGVFERARRAALDALDGLDDGDEAAFAGFAAAPERVRELGADLAALRGAVAGIEEPGFGATRFLPALELADRMLEEARFDNRAVYLISDFQRTGMQGLEGGWRLAPGVALVAVDVGEDGTGNLALTDARAPERVLEDAGEQRILARVRAAGGAHLDRGEATLLMDGETRARAAVDLRDRSEEVVAFAVSFEGSGARRGELRVSGDGFEADNSFFFTVDVLPKVRVLAVNGEPSENWFDDEGHWFGLAVAGGGESPFALEAVEPAGVDAAALARSDVVALLNVGGLSDAQARLLVEYVEAGGGLLVAPGDRVDPARFNRRFGAVAPALLAPRGGEEDYLVIADLDRRHPILRPLDGDWTARFQGRWPLEPAAGADVLMRFDNAEPALVERRAGAGRAVLFASPMDLEWSDLPLQGLFLPFVHETLRHLVETDPGPRSWRVGDRIDLDPEGAAERVGAADGEGNALELEGGTVAAARRPGFVVATVDGVETRHAVNVIPEESDLARVAPAALYDAVVNPDTSPVPSRRARTERMVEDLERSQRLWWWILALAAALLLVEALAANRIRR